jgi:membrane-bound lytic murein transglycosylase B
VQRYRAELIDALMLVQRGIVRPGQLRGAWTDEIGQTQFMPSAYLILVADVVGYGSPALNPSRSSTCRCQHAASNFLPMTVP